MDSVIYSQVVIKKQIKNFKVPTFFKNTDVKQKIIKNKTDTRFNIVTNDDDFDFVILGISNMYENTLITVYSWRCNDPTFSFFLSDFSDDIYITKAKNNEILNVKEDIKNKRNIIIGHLPDYLKEYDEMLKVDNLDRKLAIHLKKLNITKINEHDHILVTYRKNGTSIIAHFNYMCANSGTSWTEITHKLNKNDQKIMLNKLHKALIDYFGGANINGFDLIIKNFFIIDK